MDEDRGRLARFMQVWEEDAPRLLLYAKRHVGPEDAQDIVAETFATAWGRWRKVPTPALPWLIGVAKNHIRNLQRSRRRLDALADRVALLEDLVTADPGDGLVRHEALVRLARLSETHREALLLVAWDGLSIEQAARVVGVRPGAFRVRLHRARQQLDPPLARSPRQALIKESS